MIREILGLPRFVESDLASVLEAIYVQRYTGPITFHFKNGVAKTVQVMAPEIRLGSPATAPAAPDPAPLADPPPAPASVRLSVSA